MGKQLVPLIGDRPGSLNCALKKVYNYRSGYLNFSTNGNTIVFDDWAPGRIQVAGSDILFGHFLDCERT